MVLFPGAGAVAYEVRTGVSRSVSAPEVENTVKGAKDAFVETIRSNTSYIRRHLRSPDLRIFETQVVQEEGVSYIKAWAYIRRGSHTEEIIADIEAGIKKEVSVGCAMGRSVCSICGSDYGVCGHQKGEHYDGQLCCAILKEPMDAYEFSFVAVPAQPNAGVLKGMGAGKRCLKELADNFGAQAEYRALFKEAELGRAYKKQVQNDVVRLCLALELGAEEPVLRGIVKTAAAEDLMKLKSALEEKLVQSMPVMTQLGCSLGQQEEIESGFLI